jgi:hypothetical protein
MTLQVTHELSYMQTPMALCASKNGNIVCY